MSVGISDQNKIPIIAFGDALFATSLKGSKSGIARRCRKLLRGAERQGLLVFMPIDEYNISQLQRKRKPGGETPTDESEDEADDNSLYSVLACECCTRLWQRDVNAARNMHLIADHLINGR
ncbi:hypothetical protein BGW37DRAFT_478765, partial [Umbelopsis sp. PMI_123]